jgi:hypothetical protein
VQMRTRVHSWRSAVRGLAPALAVLVLGGAPIAPVLAQGTGQLSGNWSTGAIIPALANAPDLGTLRAFRGPVLLPPAGLPPFAGLALAPPSAAPRLPNGLTADGNGYSVNLGSANGWRIGGGLSTRDDFDTIGRGQPGSEISCAPSASYCDAPMGEFFRGLQVNGDSAIVIHAVGPVGESNSWSIAWFDDGAGATYVLGAGSDVTAADASAYPRGKSPAHVSAAQNLVSLAEKLVVWAPDNQQDNSTGAQPQGGGSQSQVITCLAGHLLGQGVVSYPCDDGFVYMVNPDFKLVERYAKDSDAVATWPLIDANETYEQWRWVDDQGRTCALDGGIQASRLTCTPDAGGDEAAGQ